MADYKDPENTLLIETTQGPVVIEMRPDLAPNHVAHIKKLAREGFYNGIVFHRVIDGFMAQTGDVQYGKTGGDTSMAGMGGSDMPNLPAEFSDIGLLLRTDELKDVYGNTLEDLPILEIGLSRQTLERIDWNGFEPTDFERVADRFWVHDEIRRLAAEKAAQDQVNTGLSGQTAGAAGSEGGSNE